MSGWERIEVDWLTDLFEVAPHPWREGLVFAWLRYAERCCRDRVTYWLPRRAAPQVVADARRGLLPGWRAICDATGWGEGEAKRALADWSTWLDPWSIEEDIKLKQEPRPAGYRGEIKASSAPASLPGRSRVPPGSVPGRSRVPPGSVPSAGAKEQVAPSSQSQVPPDSIPPPSQVAPESIPPPSQVPPDHARDLRAPPLPVPSPDGTPSLSPGPTPSTPGTSARPDSLFRKRSPREARRDDEGALAAVWTHARTLQTDLPDWRRGLLPASLLAYDPETLCRVLDWARLAADPDAAALRQAARERRRGALSPTYVLDYRWLGDRIARADAWDRGGRPEAADADPAPAVAEERAAALYAERLAEDQARWPGWSPPPTWQALPREYVALDALARTAQRWVSDEGHLAPAGEAQLQRARLQGWDEWHPSPPDQTRGETS